MHVRVENKTIHAKPDNPICSLTGLQTPYQVTMYMGMVKVFCCCCCCSFFLPICSYLRFSIRFSCYFPRWKEQREFSHSQSWSFISFTFFFLLSVRFEFLSCQVKFFIIFPGSWYQFMNLNRICIRKRSVLIATALQKLKGNR